MSRFLVTLRLKPGAAVEAGRILRDGPPFDVESSRLERHFVFLAADEIFSTGNFAKVAPVIRIDDRELKPGPLYTRARKLYWDFAHAVKLAA